MPSIRGFIDSLKHRVLFIVSGKGSSKMRLLLLTVLDSMPRTVRKALPPHLRDRMEYLKDVLIRNSAVKLNGNIYYIVDPESLWIISHEFERWMWRYLNLREGDVFIDVGAHIGKYTIPAARAVGGKGLVIAIEPHPENYRVLIRNIKANNLNNVIALNVAAWSGERKLKLFIGDSGSRHSVKKDFGRGYIEVPARALDSILNELKVENVDLIKIDVEGRSSRFLKGWRRLYEDIVRK